MTNNSDTILLSCPSCSWYQKLNSVPNVSHRKGLERRQVKVRSHASGFSLLYRFFPHLRFVLISQIICDHFIMLCPSAKEQANARRVEACLRNSLAYKINEQRRQMQSHRLLSVKNITQS